ncbi:MAG: hypothetical protein WA906_12150, partial [Pacificimonas sp.]
ARMRGLIAAPIVLLASSVAAQNQTGSSLVESVRDVVRCSPSDDGVIVICGQRERSRYRLPEPPARFDFGGGAATVTREREGLLSVERGAGETYTSGGSALGPNPCSNIGPSGYSGCFAAQHRDNAAQNPKNGF